MKSYGFAALILVACTMAYASPASASDKDCIFAVARAMNSLPELHIIKSSVSAGPAATGEMAAAGATIHRVDIKFQSAGTTDLWHFFCVLTPNMPAVIQRFK